MREKLTHRKAKEEDLASILALLLQDEMAKKREISAPKPDQRYLDAFKKINHDPNQYLMIVECDLIIVGSCQLTLIPSLTHIGSTRMQIEAVRVRESNRGQKIGEWMMEQAIAYGVSKGASIIQLTTDKKRLRACKFYEKLGFEATHQGFKLHVDPLESISR